MKCIFCKADLETKLTNYIADFGETVIVIRNVPTEVCKQCGEKSYSYEVSVHLQKIVDEVRKFVSGIAEINYSDAA